MAETTGDPGLGVAVEWLPPAILEIQIALKHQTGGKVIALNSVHVHGFGNKLPKGGIQGVSWALNSEALKMITFQNV